MDVAVLGAGMVGVSVAIHLLKRGRSVVLIDRNEHCVEASFGNGGLIQAEGILPHAFPRDPFVLGRIALGRNPAVHYDPLYLLEHANALARYWWNSASSRYRRIASETVQLLAHAVPAHQELAAASGAEALLRNEGWVRLFRSERSLNAAFAEADMLQAQWSIPHRKIVADDLEEFGPRLQENFAGAVHWSGSPSVSDPGGLVDSYIDLFRALGGKSVIAEIAATEPDRSGWTCRTGSDQRIHAREVVVAAGSSTARLARGLGYRLPIFIKRGYHMHYRPPLNIRSNMPVLDTEGGYLLTPVQRGIRLTTGIEFARDGAPPSTLQLKKAEGAARVLFGLGEPVDPRPWVGARICTPDMKPIIGPAPQHRGLWYAAGHAHRGFTLGPITGRVLAEAMTGSEPTVDLSPFGMDRFYQQRA